MIRLISISILLILASRESFSNSRTVEGNEFYDTWATTSSVVNPKRQVIEISPDGGRWIKRDNQGIEEVFILKKCDISIDGDILKVDYKDPKKEFRLKLILGGWAIGKNKNIFGTVYMYQEQGDGLSLFNGLSISFKNGTPKVIPKIFLSFFSPSKTQRVNSGFISKLEDDLAKLNGIYITESSDVKEYYLKEVEASISITKQGHPAHPAAIGIRLLTNSPGSISTIAKYEGNEAAFKKYYQAYLDDFDKQKMEMLREINESLEELDTEK
jgi:hypothetical protein